MSNDTTNTTSTDRFLYYSASSGITLVILYLSLVYSGIGTISTLIFLFHLGLLLASSLLGLSLIRRNSKESHLLWYTLILFILIGFISGIHPAVAKDALTHHLAVPKWWLEAGNFTPIWWHEWSFYPMLIQSAYAFFILFELTFFTSLYHALYLPILATASMLLASKFGVSGKIQLFAATLVCGLPVVINLASTPLVDLALATWSILAILSIYLAKDGIRCSSLLLGIFLGLAIATKYNGLLLLALIIPLYCYEVYSTNKRKTILYCSFVILVALIVCAPWLIRNFELTGNPIYPLHNKYFGVGSNTSSNLPSLSPIQHRLYIYDESLFDILLTPLKMIFLGEDSNPRMYDGVLSPLLILMFIPLFFKDIKKVAPLYIFVAIFYIVALSQTSWRIRYLSPLYGACSVLAAIGLSKFRGRDFSFLAAAALALHSGVYGIKHLINEGAVQFITNQQTDREYLAAHLPEINIINQINSKTPTDAGIYLLYTKNSFFYFRRRVFSGGYRSEAPLIGWIRQSKNGLELRDRFMEERLTHIFAHRALTVRGLDSALTDGEKAIWNDFVSNHLTIIEQDREYFLWIVR